MPSRENDRELLGVLASHGADLSKPAHTVHYLYFKSGQQATAAAGELRAAGYQNLRVHPAPGQSWLKRLFGRCTYSCIAEIHAVPSESQVFATTDRMEAIAAKHGGEYDGWEASVES